MNKNAIGLDNTLWLVELEPMSNTIHHVWKGLVPQVLITMQYKISLFLFLFFLLFLDGGLELKNNKIK